MKQIFCLLAILCPFCNRAQATGTLTIGDSLPAISCKALINNRPANLQLKPANGQLLLLDFMHTNCGGCVQQLAHYQQLQTQMGNSLQIVLVTTQSPAVVQQFLQRRKGVDKITLPIITADTTLQQLFAHSYIPHLVWIGSGGLVKAITAPDYVTAANLQAALDTGALPWPVKTDRPHFDYNQHLQQNVLLPCIPEVNPHMLRQLTGSQQQVRWAFFNQPVTELYLRLHGLVRFPRTQIILEVADSSRYIFNPAKHFRRNWYQQNSFCYETVLPASMPDAKQRQYIQRELDCCLNLQGRMEERLVNCLLLQALPGTSIRQPVIVPENRLTVWALLNQLNQLWNATPVFNMLPLTDTIRLPITAAELDDPICIKEALAAAGLQLTPSACQTQVLVITEPLFTKTNKQP